MKKIIVVLLLATSPILFANEHSVDTISDRHIECMAKNLYFEARGEPLLGQIAVAHVVLNRTRSDDYPSDICSVIYEPRQFTWTANSRAKIKDWRLFLELKDLSKRVIMNTVKDPTQGALRFHRVKPQSRKSNRSTIIGNHIFYT
jgi:N-acetylmuramoyl-L-alanine amidase